MPDFLYIHIPFCIKKCLYCDFFSVPYDESLVKAYVKSLCGELLLKRDLAGTLKTVYIGGGTPSLLPDECITQLLNCLRSGFDLSPLAEITAEANPGTLHERGINAMLSLGVNRLSIGIQSFNNAELKTIGRIHTAEDALRSIDLAKKAGVRNCSIDLIYGIPGQTMESWRDTVSLAIDQAPSHISAYELTPEEHTPLFALIKSGEIEMSDEELILEMYDHAIDYLDAHGYEHYEISNFARRGSRCIHNLNYWDRGEYIGLGAGAHSFVGGSRSENVRDIHDYILRVDQGVVPETQSMRITAPEALKEFLFLGLRKTEGISIEQAEKKGVNIRAACEEMIEDDYLEISDDRLRLTRKGIVVSNAVIARIFEKTGI